MKKFEKNIENRKELVTRISELTGVESRYTFVPRCAYVIGAFTVEKDGTLTVEDGAEESIVETLKAEGMIGAQMEISEETILEQDEPVRTSISFPLSHHTPTSIINLICMIHSRGPLISKATGGTFSADKTLVSDLLNHSGFIKATDVIEFIQGREGSEGQLIGLSFEEDKVVFDGFGTVEDAESVQTFMKLAAAMNKMAISQKRVQAKDVDDSNEKYALRIWLIRLGLNGDEYKPDRKRLMSKLSGHAAFRNEEERVRWTERQAAKRDALRAAKAAKEAGNPTPEAV